MRGGGGRGGGYSHPHHQAGGGPGHGRSARPITKHLEVPNELIGTIIGRHGMKISEIRYYYYYSVLNRLKVVSIALHMNPSQSYGSSTVVWDRTVLPAARHR